VGLTGLAGAVALLVSGADLALGIALGALFGYANLRLLGRSVLSMLSIAGSTPEGPGDGSKILDPEDILDFTQSAPSSPLEPLGTDTPAPERRGNNFIRLPALALAMVLILWYMPARPEGFLLGLVLSLLAAIGAAIQASRHDRRSP
jgi:hypothetical protein